MPMMWILGSVYGDIILSQLKVSQGTSHGQVIPMKQEVLLLGL